MAPLYLSITIAKVSDSPLETRGYWSPSELSKTRYFRIYALLMLLMESPIPLVALIALNIAVLVKFRKIMANKRRLRGGGQRVDGAISRFTRLILALSLICIVTRSIDATIAVLRRLNAADLITLSDQYKTVLNFFSRVSIFLMLAEHGLDVLLYYRYDNNLRVFLSGSSDRS